MSVQFLHETHVKSARKAHHCRTCNELAAAPGQSYTRETFAYDGAVYNWVQCAECRQMSREVLDWAIDDESGVGAEEYAEWAAEHAEYGTPEQQAKARAYLARLNPTDGQEATR